MDINLIVTFAGILVAGLAGVLGVWMERDPEAPPRWAFVFSGLIALAVTVELGHAAVQASEDAETQEATASVLEQLSDLAEKGDNPALEQFVGSELAAQSRSNPRMMKRMEARMRAKGKDPNKLRRRAQEGRRKAAGLPGKRKRKAKGGEGGKRSAEGGEARGKAPAEGGDANTERAKTKGRTDGADGQRGKAKQPAGTDEAAPAEGGRRGKAKRPE